MEVVALKFFLFFCGECSDDYAKVDLPCGRIQSALAFLNHSYDEVTPDVPQVCPRPRCLEHTRILGSLPHLAGAINAPQTIISSDQALAFVLTLSKQLSNSPIDIITVEKFIYLEIRSICHLVEKILKANFASDAEYQELKDRIIGIKSLINKFRILPFFDRKILPIPCVPLKACIYG